MLVGRLVKQSGGYPTLVDPDGWGDTLSTAVTGWPALYGVSNTSTPSEFWDEGNHILIMNHLGDRIVKVPCTTPYDPTTYEAAPRTDDEYHDDGTNVGLTNGGWNAAGSLVWYFDNFGGTIGRVYRLTSPTFALTDASMGSPQGGNIPSGSSITNEFWAKFMDEGTTFFMSGSDGSTAYISQFDCGTPWDITTATYQAEITIPAVCFGAIFDSTSAGKMVYFDSNRVLRSFDYTDKTDITTYSDSGVTKNLASLGLNTSDGCITMDLDGDIYFYEITGSYRIMKLTRV